MLCSLQFLLLKGLQALQASWQLFRIQGATALDRILFSVQRGRWSILSSVSLKSHTAFAHHCRWVSLHFSNKVNSFLNSNQDYPFMLTKSHLPLLVHHSILQLWRCHSILVIAILPSFVLSANLMSMLSTSASKAPINNVKQDSIKEPQTVCPNFLALS